MRKFLIPTKDTTLYESYPTNNAGLDEILEIGKVVDTTLTTTTYASASARSLLYFDLPTTESVDINADYYLNLKLANASNIQRNQRIDVLLVSQSWDEGSGFFYQNVKNVNDGATWRQCSTNLSWSAQGGDFNQVVSSASVFLNTYPIQDIRVNVTELVRPFVSQSLQNNFYGLVLKFPNEDEIDTDNEGNVKVFSAQTHTIHQPTLEVVWDSQVFSTGSLKSIPSSLNMKIATNDLQETYSKGDVVRINLVVRDPYPLKSFDSTLRYKNKYYLPQTTYYSIQDVQSKTTVVPFDSYAKVDCDTNGSYITLDTTSLYSGRFYALTLKVVSGSYTKTINPDIGFSIL